MPQKDSHWKVLDEVLKKRKTIYPGKTTKNKENIKYFSKVGCFFIKKKNKKTGGSKNKSIITQN